MNRLSMMFALCVVAACSDSSDGLNASQESLRKGTLADGGAVLGHDHDRDADESAEEALTDGGHHKDHFEGRDGGNRRGRMGNLFGDGGCRGRGGFGGDGHDGDQDDQDDESADGGSRELGGDDKGHGGRHFDGGVAP